MCSWRKHEGEGDVQGWTYGPLGRSGPLALLQANGPVRGTRMMRGVGEGGVGPVNEGRKARRRLPERGVLRTGSRGAFTAC